MTGIMGYLLNKQLIEPLQRLLMVSRDKQEKEIPEKWIHSHKKMDISLRNRFIAAFTLAFLIPNIILAYAGYSFNRRELESLRMGYMEAVTDSIVRDVDSLIYNYESMIKDLIFNNEIQYVMNHEQFPLDYEHRSGITQSILKTKFNRDGLLNVKIYKTNGDLLYSLTGGEQHHDENIFNETPLLKGRNLKTISLWSFTNRNTQKVEINLLREIRGFGEMAIIGGMSREFEKIGYMSMSISEIALLKAYDNVVIPLSGIAVVDSDQRIISCSSSFFNGRLFSDFRDEIYKQLGVNESKVINKKIQSNGWKVMLFMDYNDIREEVKNNILLSFYLVFFVFFIMLFLIIALIGRMVMPIERLNYGVRSISEKGGFLTAIKENMFGYDEIDNLGRSYNSLIDRINTLIRTVYLEEVKRVNTENKKKEAEMNALQAQINPHFIYNTLESINWIIKLNRNEEASRMIKLFSDLLHVLVDRRNLCVSIEEELNHIDIYIKLQQIRYKGRLAFVNNVPGKIMKYKTLKLLLQPLVENAIVHGMNASGDILTIVISAEVQDNCIVINISDDGAGIAQGKLDEINQGLKADSMESIGVKNVNDRIQLYFGNQYYLKLNSINGEGTTVIIRLPVIE
jgi:sensor histidine kinase YesM